MLNMANRFCASTDLYWDLLQQFQHLQPLRLRCRQLGPRRRRINAGQRRWA
jgi:hypothetical protein